MLTRDGSVLDVRTFRKDVNNRIFVIGEILEVKWPVFHFPLNSVRLKMLELHTEPSGKEETFLIEDVQFKLVKLGINLKENGPLNTYIMPHLHS